MEAEYNNNFSAKLLSFIKDHKDLILSAKSNVGYSDYLDFFKVRFSRKDINSAAAVFPYAVSLDFLRQYEDKLAVFNTLRPGGSFPFYFSFIFQFNEKNHLLCLIRPMQKARNQVELVLHCEHVSFGSLHYFYDEIFPALENYKLDEFVDDNSMGHPFTQ